MQVFKCDRCGDIYDSPATKFGMPKYTIQKHIFPATDIELDLCPSCLALLENFMETKMTKGDTSND